jgi:predicted mannosyl-3-phosphoglycerate phosphatase (HAD superfamily)
MTNIAYDIDGTLINFDNTPNYDVIENLLSFQKLGVNVYIWSGGGILYAEHWRDKLGLKAIVIEKTKNEKIDIAFDDENVDLAKVNIQVRRNNTEVI